MEFRGLVGAGEQLPGGPPISWGRKRMQTAFVVDDAAINVS
jgi:hypothetical protein